MNNSNEFKEHLNVVCELIEDALHKALDEIESQDSVEFCEDIDAVIARHVSKRFDYMKQEGWIEEGEFEIVTEETEDEGD